MEGRNIALVIYAGIFGWYLHKWWQGTREELVWDTAERVFRRIEIAEQSRTAQPDPASTATA